MTTPCCLLGSRLLDDVAVHLKGKSGPCVRWFVFLWIVTYCLWRHFIQITGICKETLVCVRRRLLLLQELAWLFLTFSKRLTIWPDKTGQTLKTHIFPNPSYAGLYSAVKRSSTCETKQLRDWCAALLLTCRSTQELVCEWIPTREVRCDSSFRHVIMLIFVLNWSFGSCAISHWLDTTWRILLHLPLSPPSLTRWFWTRWDNRKIPWIQVTRFKSSPIK